MRQTGVLLCGHGSRDPEAIGEFELLAKALRSRLPGVDFATGYLEFARPTIRDGLAALAARGARRILAAPGMLFAASHVKNDLPWEVNSFAADNPGDRGAFWSRPRHQPEIADGGGRPHRGGIAERPAPIFPTAC